jgi:hypothetical protein
MSGPGARPEDICSSVPIFTVTRVTSYSAAAWQGAHVEIKHGLAHANQEPAMQTRLTNIAQRYPALAASVSLLGVIAFYVAAASAFAS